MALMVVTSRPKELLAKIKKAIDEGHIDTWVYDVDGDFTHSRPQFDQKAWMRPSIGQGCLSFGLLGKRDVVMTKLIYGIYHGRFAEMLLTHFDIDFSSLQLSALGETPPDNFK